MTASAGLGSIWDMLGARWGSLRDAIGFRDSLAVWPAWLAPPVALTAALALIALAGVALAALATLLTVLLAAVLLLEYAFGVQVQIG